ncbi:glutamyl-tRNA reductase [Alicyclobacillus contaminans]|uniref:glutamyl-tRNA reductase n=1 Tax=Alicyclobacillus contaminans TaxID=392016 RepID=UPI00040CF233|nr:glutamyl-tRNA reductase [Alicyclobacillus contaminans]GMA52336.1 glutamyl-tRNA reductase [Alicyclobacillus contaminans]
MHIMVVGLNHTTAPVEVRERVAISDVELDDVLAQFRHTRTVLECVVLSTCNRTELYAVVNSERAGEDFLVRFLVDRAGLDMDTLKRQLYVKTGQSAVTHLMRVASGLDSMVVGETQILGQVRSAFLAAADAGATGALLNQLFRLAVHVGKRAQSETSIGQHPVSVSYAAVQLAKKVFGELGGRTALLIGAGSISRLTAQHLKAAGIERLLVVNRTFERAQQLADEFGGTAVEWDRMVDVLSAADIVVSATRHPGYVIPSTLAEQAMLARNHRPTMYIDLAVPRDIHPDAGHLRNAYVYDIDDLEGVVAANLAERERQAAIVEKLIAASLREYSQWLCEQEVVPLISAVRAKGEAIQTSVMESLKRKLPNLSEREVELLHKHTMSIVNQLLRDPVLAMKELATEAGGAKYVPLFAELFGLTREDLKRYSKESWQTAGGHGEEHVSGGLVEIAKSLGLLPRSGDVGSAPLHPVLR